MDDETLSSLRDVIDYLWQDERKHWEEEGKPDSHIFVDLRRLARWLDNQ